MSDRIFITITLLLAFTSFVILTYCIYTKNAIRYEELRLIEKAIDAGRPEIVQAIRE